MKDEIEVARQCGEHCVIGDRGLHEVDGRVRGNIGDVGRQQIVDDRHPARPHRQQPADQRAADKARAADHQHRGAGEIRFGHE